jgi:diacylglycerol kinase family enzyme
MRMALRQYYLRTDRRHPALALETPAGPTIAPLGMALISNTTPWSYIGRHPVSPTPDASFDTGLDVFALRRLRTFSTLNAMRQMMRRDFRPPTGRYVVSLHDETEVTVSSREPTAIQVDGEYVGEGESVTFRSVPEALRVIA